MLRGSITLDLYTLHKQLPGKIPNDFIGGIYIRSLVGCRIFKENGGGKIIMTASIKYEQLKFPPPPPPFPNG